MVSSKVPLIDFKNLSLQPFDPENPETKKLGLELDKALREFGCCYIQHHGISQDVISSVFEKSKDFFKLPAEVKKIYTKSDDKQNAYGGYYVSQNQSFRERFDITLNSCNGKLPENHAPGFQLACETFRKECNKTAQLVFKLIAKTFGKEEKFLVNQHRGALFGDMECETKSHLSSIFYQNVEIGENKKESLLMGSHKDFTTITLLMSSAPGLQVLPNDGEEWVDVNPREGCILMHAGELLEIWSGGTYGATVHRVLNKNREDSAERQSIPYFLHPDCTTVIEPIVEPVNNGKSYTPVRAKDYWNQQMAKRSMAICPTDAGDVLTPASA